MEADEDRHEAVEATTTVPGSADPRSGERFEDIHLNTEQAKCWTTIICLIN